MRTTVSKSGSILCDTLCSVRPIKGGKEGGGVELNEDATAV